MGTYMCHREPTMNKIGVRALRAVIGTRKERPMCNIGFRPTVNDELSNTTIFNTVHNNLNLMFTNLHKHLIY